MTTPIEEELIIEDIIDGLGIAIHEEGWDYDQIDPIKFNKLLYLAVKHFDLPVTYRWYQYGADFTPHGYNRDDVVPCPASELATPDEPSISEPSRSADEYPSPREIADFYAEEVEGIQTLFENDTKEYLHTFYQNYAPEGLEDVYTACSLLQKSLDDIGRADNPGEVADELTETVLEEIRTLNREVYACELVSDVDRRFTEYASLLKDVIITIDDFDDNLNPTQEERLVNVVRFFYTKAWRFVALKIATERAEGNQAFEWRETAGTRFTNLARTYDEELRFLRKQTERVGLVADEFREYTEPVVRQANRSQEAELSAEVAKRWEGVSREANREL